MGGVQTNLAVQFDGRLREALRLVKLARELYAGAGVTDRNDMVDAVQERVQRQGVACHIVARVVWNYILQKMKTRQWFQTLSLSR